MRLTLPEHQDHSQHYRRAEQGSDAGAGHDQRMMTDAGAERGFGGEAPWGNEAEPALAAWRSRLPERLPNALTSPGHAPRRRRTRSDGLRAGVAGPPTVRRGPRIGPRRGRASGLTAGVSLGVFQPLYDGRLNIPSVFRVGYGLGLRGGVKPMR